MWNGFELPPRHTTKTSQSFWLSTTLTGWLSLSQGLLFVASIVLLLIASGCSSVLPIRSAPAQAIALPTIQPVRMLPIEWEVRVEGEQAYMCLPTHDYESLSKNTAELSRWMMEAQGRLDYYDRVGGIDSLGASRNASDTE